VTRPSFHEAASPPPVFGRRISLQTRPTRDPFIHLFPPVGAVLHQPQGFPANQPSWPANHAGHQTRPARDPFIHFFPPV